VDIQEKINVTFTTEDYAEAEYNLLPCAVQETDALSTEYKNAENDMRKRRQQRVSQFLSADKQCCVWIHTTTSSVAFLTCQSQSSETCRNWKMLFQICLKHM
jgi:hypothetical protein